MQENLKEKLEDVEQQLEELEENFQKENAGIMQPQDSLVESF